MPFNVHNMQFGFYAQWDLSMKRICFPSLKSIKLINKHFINFFQFWTIFKHILPPNFRMTNKNRLKCGSGVGLTKK